MSTIWRTIPVMLPGLVLATIALALFAAAIDVATSHISLFDDNGRLYDASTMPLALIFTGLGLAVSYGGVVLMRRIRPRRSSSDS